MDGRRSFDHAYHCKNARASQNRYLIPPVFDNFHLIQLEAKVDITQKDNQGNVQNQQKYRKEKATKEEAYGLSQQTSLVDDPPDLANKELGVQCMMGIRMTKNLVDKSCNDS